MSDKDRRIDKLLDFLFDGHDGFTVVLLPSQHDLPIECCTCKSPRSLWETEGGPTLGGDGFLCSWCNKIGCEGNATNSPTYIWPANIEAELVVLKAMDHFKEYGIVKKGNAWKRK